MPEQPPTLRDMIQAARGRGRSLRDLEAKAVDEHGNTAGKDTIRKIANGDMPRMPLESQLRAIAAALGVPYVRVWEAAINEWLPAPAGAIPTDARPVPDTVVDDLRRIRDEAEATLARIEGETGSAAASG